VTVERGETRERLHVHGRRERSRPRFRRDQDDAAIAGAPLAYAATNGSGASPEDLVPGSEKLADDGGADKTGRAGHDPIRLRQDQLT